MKNVFTVLAVFIIFSARLFAIDLLKTANRDFLTIEETLELAEKDSKNYGTLISGLEYLKKVCDGQIKADSKEIDSVVDQCPYMPCMECVRLLFLSDEDILNSANYIYSVFTGCPKENKLKDQIYLRILQASVAENNFDWSFNAARDISDEAKKSDIYKAFLKAKNH
ncbi:MAG: hypothetical protein MJ181_00790 [Treponema sp.]|nr:hypothetical protein [Treponema sp.]